MQCSYTKGFTLGCIQVLESFSPAHERLKLQGGSTVMLLLLLDCHSYFFSLL